MKVVLLDKERRKVHLPDVSEVVIMNDEGDPIAVSTQQGDLVTTAHAAEPGFAQIAKQCGLVPPEVKVLR